MKNRVLTLLILIALVFSVIPGVAYAAEPPQQEMMDSVPCVEDYTVQLADWVSKIAERYLGDPLAYPAILMATNMAAGEGGDYAVVVDPDILEAGQKLCIPSEEDAQALLARSYDIHLSTKDIGPNNPFWQTVWDGAEVMANKWLGIVNYTVNAPTSEADVDVQIAQLEDAITKGVDAMIVAPTDASALNPTFDRAKEAGIPILIIDSSTTWPDKLTFIGTDNKAGGRLAGEYICSQVGSGGKVAIVSGQETASSIADRVAGAQEAFEACGAEVVAKISGDHSRAGGQTVMEDILVSNPDVQAVFAINDNEALGATEALKAAEKLDQVMVVGFDANPDAVASILNGEMSATIAQAPQNMGGYGVAWSLNYLLGVEVPDRIDTGTTLVTAENAPQFQ